MPTLQKEKELVQQIEKSLEPFRKDLTQEEFLGSLLAFCTKEMHEFSIECLKFT